MTSPQKGRNYSLTFQAVSNVAGTQEGVSSIMRHRSPSNFFQEDEIENAQDHNNGIPITKSGN